MALQLGHRVSRDLDFFSEAGFDAEELRNNLNPDETSIIRKGTLHALKDGVRISFLFYALPLVFPCHPWRGIEIASWEDIIAEKFKNISQRGSKKDFYDLYAGIVLKASIDHACRMFKRRFSETDINLYHVLKSLVYFEDADEEPEPGLIMEGKEWAWSSVKGFFEKHIKDFEVALLG